MECQAMKLVVRFGMTILHVFLVSPYLKHPIRHKPQNPLAFMYLGLWWNTRIHVEVVNYSLNLGDTLNFTAGVLFSKKVLNVNMLNKIYHRWLVVSWLPKPLPLRGKLRNNTFEYISEDAQRRLKYTLLSNGDENSFSFIITQNEEPVRWWTLSNIGQIFDGEVYVARADLCYGYNNTDGGCQRWQDIPKCRNPGDVFQKHTGSVRVHNVSTEENISYGHSNCEASCWSNCACSGFTDLNSNGTGCIFLYLITVENYTYDTTGYKKVDMDSCSSSNSSTCNLSIDYLPSLKEEKICVSGEEESKEGDNHVTLSYSSSITFDLWYTFSHIGMFNTEVEEDEEMLELIPQAESVTAAPGVLVVRFGMTLLHVFLVSPYLKHSIWHKPQNLLALMYLWLWWSTRIHVEVANDSLSPGDTLNFTARVLCSKKVTY
ncbi:hypothetical protein V8G54_023386 [Vigna mungo]|uniref:Apple domain-containing protein n=1 Tax=Vigna mungo TaxID=3915 RepID=A0AAQ3N317_VIGMU